MHGWKHSHPRAGEDVTSGCSDARAPHPYPHPAPQHEGHVNPSSNQVLHPRQKAHILSSEGPSTGSDSGHYMCRCAACVCMCAVARVGKLFLPSLWLKHTEQLRGKSNTTPRNAVTEQGLWVCIPGRAHSCSCSSSSHSQLISQGLFHCMLLHLRPAERGCKTSANLKRKPTGPSLRAEKRDVFIGANLLALATRHQKKETYCFSLLS